MSRIIAWFSTKSGRIFTRSCVGLAAFGVFASRIAFHGPALDKVIEVTQVYSHGEPKQLSEAMTSVKEQVLHDSNLTEEEKKKIRFYYVVGHSLLHFGGLGSPFGAAIGIPFTFENIKDVNFNHLKLYGKEIDWVIDGHDLISALTLSDDAKKFGLMKEIYSCDFYQVVENAALASVFVLIPARLCQIVNKKHDALTKIPFQKRAFYYAFFYAFGYALYRCLKGPLKHLTDKKVDEKAAKAGPNYLEGGIEFYKKTLAKNKALREALGQSGRRKFDAEGNEAYFILTPKLPITKRLELLQKLKREQLH